MVDRSYFEMFTEIEQHFADCRTCWPLREPLFEATQRDDRKALDGLEQRLCEEQRENFTRLTAIVVATKR